MFDLSQELRFRKLVNKGFSLIAYFQTTWHAQHLSITSRTTHEIVKWAYDYHNWMFLISSGTLLNYHKSGESFGANHNLRSRYELQNPETQPTAPFPRPTTRRASPASKTCYINTPLHHVQKPGTQDSQSCIYMQGGDDQGKNMRVGLSVPISGGVVDLDVFGARTVNVGCLSHCHHYAVIHKLAVKLLPAVSLSSTALEAAEYLHHSSPSEASTLYQPW